MRSTMHMAGKRSQQRIMATYSVPKQSRSAASVHLETGQQNLFTTNQNSSVRKSSEPLEWNENAEQAFPTAKSATAEATLLRHPIPGAQWADSSRVAIGCTLSQSSQETWEPFLHET
ncbi:RT_RNaseH_2 domain-containing protein [Trichonephila clavipes]|nr:RT_RNaseH_2 domain-containing protein [Trichonephila clavipes]